MTEVTTASPTTTRRRAIVSPTNGSRTCRTSTHSNSNEMSITDPAPIALDTEDTRGNFPNLENRHEPRKSNPPSGAKRNEEILSPRLRSGLGRPLPVANAGRVWIGPANAQGIPMRQVGARADPHRVQDESGGTGCSHSGTARQHRRGQRAGEQGESSSTLGSHAAAVAGARRATPKHGGRQRGHRTQFRTISEFVSTSVHPPRCVAPRAEPETTRNYRSLLEALQTAHASLTKPEKQARGAYRAGSPSRKRRGAEHQAADRRATRATTRPRSGYRTRADARRDALARLGLTRIRRGLLAPGDPQCVQHQVSELRVRGG